MSHILIVGGTGMLKNVSLYFAFHSMTVSVIAQNKEGLDNLISLKGDAGFINPVAVDYGNSTFLKEKISNAVDSFGEIDIAVCWIHSDAGEAPFIIADILNKQSQVCRYFQIHGSAFADPAKASGRIEEKFLQYKKIIYKKIILGFVIEENHSQWLTNTEISNGVIDAINKDADEFIIGTVEPWEMRP